MEADEQGEVGARTGTRQVSQTWNGGPLVSSADVGREAGPAHDTFHAPHGAAWLGLSDIVLGEE